MTCITQQPPQVDDIDYDRWAWEAMYFASLSHEEQVAYIAAQGDGE